MLFNSFDSMFFKEPTLIAMAFLTLWLSNFYKNNIRTSVMASILSPLVVFFEEVNSKFLPKTFMILAISIILNIFLMNFLSVHPYIFAYTSQISVILPLILSAWLSCVLFSSLNYFDSFLGHFIPQGAPFYLVIFLFLIEIVSMLIRPITACLRIVANIMAGHLLMILLSNVVLFVLPTLPGFMILNVAELTIAAIQAYIFVTMISLYLCDLR